MNWDSDPGGIVAEPSCILDWDSDASDIMD